MFNLDISKFWKTLIRATVCGLFMVSAVAAQEWPSESNPEWEELLLAGKEDGELVLIGDPALGGVFVEQFEADTGISVQFISAGRREGRVRYYREIESGNPTIDIYFGGSSLMALVAKNLLVPIGEKLVLPEVLNSENWREGKIPFVDNAGVYLPLSSQYVSGKVLINTDVIDVDDIHTWDDLLSPEYSGKIASHDPRGSGGGQILAVYLDDQKGDEYLEALYNGQNVEFSTDYRQITDWVARGTYPIGLSAVPRDIDKYRAQGLTNLSVITMEDSPGYLVGGSAALSVPINSPNPNAAAVFANWFLSKHAQEIYAAQFRLPSDRVDVQTNTWPEYIVPVAGTNYVNFYTEDFRTEMRENILPRVKAIVGDN